MGHTCPENFRRTPGLHERNSEKDRDTLLCAAIAVELCRFTRPVRADTEAQPNSLVTMGVINKHPDHARHVA